MGWKTYPNCLKISYYAPLAIGQACRLLDGPERWPRWLCRFDRITNHESPLTNHLPVRHSPASAHLRQHKELVFEFQELSWFLST
jgi:hypothetical protein